MRASATRWIPQGAEVEAVERPDLKVAAYLYTDSHGRRCVVGYQGRSKKPALHVGSTNPDQTARELERWIRAQEARTAQRLAEREAQRQFVCRWPVGTILYATWGWEQTNVDFYEVVGVRGAKTVVLRRLQSEIAEYGAGAMSGYSTPVPGQYRDDAFTARAKSENYAAIDGRKLAHLWDGRPIGCSWYG